MLGVRIESYDSWLDQLINDADSQLGTSGYMSDFDDPYNLTISKLADALFPGQPWQDMPSFIFHGAVWYDTWLNGQGYVFGGLNTAKAWKNRRDGESPADEFGRLNGGWDM